MDEHLSLESVRCLQCGAVYAKPRDRGTIASNPGCPRCGDVGWVPDGLSSAQRRDRSGADRPRPRLSQRR